MHSFAKPCQDKFWKFATQLWESQEAEVIEGNVNDMASAAAEKYLATLPWAFAGIKLSASDHL